MIKPQEVARQWGLQKKDPTMTYYKMARALRNYYGQNLIAKCKQKYQYKFCNKEILKVTREPAHDVRPAEAAAPPPTKPGSKKRAKASAAARTRDTAVPAEGNGDLQTLICVLVARPRRCLTLSNPVP